MDNTDFNQHKFNILIVDDLPKNIQVVASILQKENYHLAFAQSGHKALSHVKYNQFDLILLDVMMPDMDGFEVCRQLKANEETRDIPVIFLTAKADTDSIVKGFDSGAVDYVTKPFNGTELLVRVKTHLELKSTRQDLEEANTTKDRFFSIIAHDLKNPFNGLLGLSELLIRHYDRFDDEKRKKLLNDIKNVSELTFKLLQNLLDWSRMQTGKMQWVPEELDLYYLVEENIALHKTNAESKQINLYSTVPKDTPVYADRSMIVTVIRNLISNAIKYTRAGGDVKVSSKTTCGFEKVMVSDTGLGMSVSDMDKLFRIDVHSSRPGTEKEPGTGLGLILCKEFVEKNRGRISADSEPGKGSDFTFTIMKMKNED